MAHRCRYSFRMAAKNTTSLVLSLCLVLSIFLAPLSGARALAASYPLDESDSEIQDALEYLSSRQEDDGSIGGFAVSAWAVMAIAAAGEDPDDSDWEGISGDSIVDYLESEAGDQIDDDKATDWARMILAIVAADKDPTDFDGEDYVAGLEDLYEEENETGYDLLQIGDEGLLNDDFWGVLALVAADENVDNDIIDFILEWQNSDDGWGIEVDGDSDVDSTAAAIMALRAAGESASSTPIQDALGFLLDSQNSDGGFPMDPGDESNSASTSWAICALEAAGEDPDGSHWEADDGTPVEFLLDLQDGDGYFERTLGEDDDPEWMTAYAIPALLGMPYPVPAISSGGGDASIERSPDELMFRATEGGSNPLDQTLEIWNDGDGTLDWEVSDDAVWLDTGATSGSSSGEKDDVDVSVDIAALVAGTYEATLTITSADADNSPREVDVVLYVEEATTDDEIAVRTDEFEFAAETGDDDPEDQILEIWNSGVDENTMEWELDVDCDDDWLDVNPEDGESSGEHDDVALRVDIDGLDVGDYEATITITSNDADNSPVTIDVVLEMTGDPLVEDPEIDVSDDELEFEATVDGDDPDDETLEISNSGEGTLEWSASDDAGWLSLSPRSGSLDAGDSEDIDVSIDVGSLDEGEYEAEITIKDNDASNSPVTVDVVLTIEAAEDADGGEEGFYQLTVGISPGGAGSVARDLLPQSSGYAEGTSVTLTVTASPGYAFVGWTGDALGTQNPVTIVMSQDRTVSASFMQFDAAGLTNVSLSYVAPGIGAISVIPYPISTIPSSPPGFQLLSAYVVEPQGTGSFSLQFDGLPDVGNVAVFTVIGGQWGQMPRSVVGDSSLQVTLSESDSLIALAYPGGSGSGIMKTLKGLFDGGDATTYIIVGAAAIIVIGIVVALFVFVRRDEY